MPYDATTPHPRHPEHQRQAHSRRWRRAYLMLQLGLGLFLAFYSALLAVSTLLPLAVGRAEDPVNVLLLATWSLAGLVCATRSIKACWSVLAGGEG